MAESTLFSEPLDPRVTARDRDGDFARDEWPAILTVLSRQWMLVAFWATVCLIFGIIYLGLAPHRYTAVTRLVVDAKQSSRTEPIIDAAVVDSQAEIIRSDTIALAVIRQLALADDPKFNSPSAPEIIRKMLGLSGVPEKNRLYLTLDSFRRQLNVRPLGRSYVVDIEFTSPNSEQAARIANAVAIAYIQDQLETRAVQNRALSRELQERIAELQKRMSNAYLTLETRKADSSAASLEGQVALRELETEAQAYKAMHEAFVNRYVQAIQQQSSPVTDARIITESIPPFNPSSPKVLSTLAASSVAGLLVGLLAAFAREHRRRPGRLPRPV